LERVKKVQNLLSRRMCACAVLFTRRTRRYSMLYICKRARCCITRGLSPRPSTWELSCMSSCTAFDPRRADPGPRGAQGAARAAAGGGRERAAADLSTEAQPPQRSCGQSSLPPIEQTTLLLLQSFRLPRNPTRPTATNRQAPLPLPRASPHWRPRPQGSKPRVWLCWPMSRAMCACPFPARRGHAGGRPPPPDRSPAELRGGRQRRRSRRTSTRGGMHPSHVCSRVARRSASCLCTPRAADRSTHLD